MKMRIYTTSVISRGIYTPKVFFSCIWYALKNPGLGLGGRGWGVRAYYTQKSAYHMYAKIACHIHAKTVFGV